MAVSNDAVQMATYTEHVVELHDWLAQVQESLQRTLVEVQMKLEKTELEKKTLLADSSQDKPASQETLTAICSPTVCALTLKSESADQVPLLPGMIPSSQDEGIEDVPVLLPSSKPEAADQMPLSGTVPSSQDEGIQDVLVLLPSSKSEAADQIPLSGAVPSSKDEEVPDKPVMLQYGPSQSALRQTTLSSQKHSDVPSPQSQPAQPSILRSESSSRRMQHEREREMETHLAVVMNERRKPKRAWSLRLKDCLLKLTCSRRRKDKRVKPYVFVYEDVVPTILFGYTAEENREKALREKIMEWRMSVRVPEWLWQKHIVVKDASLHEFSLTEIERLEIDDKELCQIMVFPLRVCWRWLRPDWLPQSRGIEIYRDKIWFKVMGVWANNELRAYHMRLHKRLLSCTEKIQRLAHSHYEAEEKAEVATVDTVLNVIYVLIEIESVLCLPFQCDTDNISCGEFVEAVGCSGAWNPVIQSYMQIRNNAVKKFNQEEWMRPIHIRDTRGDFINAARAITDGLEMIDSQLSRLIDANDLLLFKYTLLVINCITCVAQFAWGKYIQPLTVEPTPMPTWQQQIAKIYKNSTGG